MQAVLAKILLHLLINNTSLNKFDYQFTKPDGYEYVSGHALIITDFNAGTGGDKLDITDLLQNGASGYDGTNPFAAGYLNLVQSGSDTLLQFDADGSSGNTYSMVTAAVLQNVSLTELNSSNFSPDYPLDGSPAVGQLINGTALADTLLGLYV